jgi:hypothetical protein
MNKAGKYVCILYVYVLYAYNVEKYDIVMLVT